jgi:uncharacterized protein (TIGR02001 family)
LARIVQNWGESQHDLQGVPMKKKSVLVTSFLTLGAAGALAQATPAPAAPEPLVPLTANINLTTKYKFRGQDQGNTDWFSPALQGGFDWSSNGFYIGNWNSNVSFTNAALEMDFYAGYKGEITKEFGYDVGVLQYYDPQKDKNISLSTTEIYGALTWTWLALKYSYTTSGDYFGLGALQQAVARETGGTLSGGGNRGGGTGYVELNANVPVVDKLTVNAHVGYTHMAKKLRNATIDGGEGSTTDVGLKSYYDYKVGLTYDMSAFLGSGVSAAAAYVGASKKEFYRDINKGRVILTISKAM